MIAIGFTGESSLPLISKGNAKNVNSSSPGSSRTPRTGFVLDTQAQIAYPPSHWKRVLSPPHRRHSPLNRFQSRNYRPDEASYKKLGPFAINVNAVAPCIMLIDPVKRQISGREDVHIAKIPLNRGGTPEDVANVVSFLSSHLSDHITGCVREVNDGMVLG